MLFDILIFVQQNSLQLFVLFIHLIRTNILSITDILNSIILASSQFKKDTIFQHLLSKIY